MAVELGEGPDTGPITDDHREAAFEYLRSLAAESDDAAAFPDEADHAAEKH